MGVRRMTAAGSRDLDAAHQDGTQSRLIKLAPEAAASSGIIAQPTVRGEFRTFREFPPLSGPTNGHLLKSRRSFAGALSMCTRTSVNK